MQVSTVDDNCGRKCEMQNAQCATWRSSVGVTGGCFGMTWSRMRWAVFLATAIGLLALTRDASAGCNGGASSVLSVTSGDLKGIIENSTAPCTLMVSGTYFVPSTIILSSGITVRSSGPGPTTIYVQS